MPRPDPVPTPTPTPGIAGWWHDARAQLRSPPARRTLVYLATLAAALGVVLIGGKLHKVARTVAEGVSPVAPGLTGAAGDVGFLVLWTLVWGAMLHLTVGWRRTVVAATFQGLTIALMMFLVVEHAFYLVTGTNLDWELLVYTAAHAAKLRKVIASEVSLGWWGAWGVAVAVGALPWLWRPKVDDPTARWRPTVVTAALLLGALVVVQIGFGGREMPAKLGLLRPSPLVTHARDALRWTLTAGDDPGASTNDRPVTPLVVVKTERTKPLNVVLITLESVRAQSLTPYAPKVPTTPKLAQLAKRGALFETAYTVMPHTTKSLIPIHCGIHPKLTHYFDESSDGSMPTDCLAKVLRRQGWMTHFFQNPESMFERRRDLVTAFGFEHLTADEQLDHTGHKKAGYFGYEDNILVQPTLDWIDAHKKAHPEQPFFIGMLNVTTHHPYAVPKGFPKKDWGVNKKLAKYYNTLNYLDQFLDKLFKGFDERGLADNTVFVLVGDHGEGFGEHGLFQHDHTIYEEGMRVPLILLGPGVPKGARKRGLRQHVDIMPTVLELLGLEVAAGELPGKSLVSTDGHERVFFSCWKKGSCRAMREGDLKIIHYFGKRDDEAYDLAADPGEKEDLLAKGKLDKAKLKAALAHMKTWGKEVQRRYNNQGARRRHAYVSTSKPKIVGKPVDITFGGWVKLIGAHVDKTMLQDGESTWVTTQFQVLKKPPKNGQMWLHFLGPWHKGKRKRQMADHVPVEGSYPVGEWKVGEYITDRHWLRVKPGQKPGDWELHMGFWDPDRNARSKPEGTGLDRTPFRSVLLADMKVHKKGKEPPKAGAPLAALSKEERALVWPADSERPVPTPSGVTATWGGLIRLRGVDRGPVAEAGAAAPKQAAALRPGEESVWTFHLEVIRDIPRWTDVFLHVTGPGLKGKKHRNLSVAPFGHRLPLHSWQPGWRVAVQRGVGAKKKWPPGTYNVWLGFWDLNLTTPAHRHPAVTTSKTRKHAVLVGTFEVSGPPRSRPPRPSR